MQKQKLINDISANLQKISENDLIWLFEQLGHYLLDQEGNSVLHFAASKGFEAACKHFLKLGANSKLSNSHGMTPAMIALESGHLDLALILNSASGLLHDAAGTTVSENWLGVSKGSFQPTLNTNLNDGDADWSLPIDFDQYPEWAKNPENQISSNDFLHEYSYIKRISVEQGLCLEEAALAIYKRFQDTLTSIRFFVGAPDQEEEFLDFFNGLMEDQPYLFYKLGNELSDHLNSINLEISQTLEALQSDFEHIQRALEWIKENSDSLALKGRLLKIEKDLVLHRDQLNDIFNSASKISANFSVADLGELIGADVKQEIFESIRGWFLDYGRNSSMIYNLCDIMQHDLFEEISSDANLLKLDFLVNLPPQVKDYFSNSGEDKIEDFFDPRLWDLTITD